jgi:predicted XRE-type DNA-binding protein
MPKSTKTPSRPLGYRIGSGNVFRDIGVPRPAEALTKAQLVIKISEAIAKRKLTQKAAAALVGLDQPKISRLINGDTTGFSIDRLLEIVAALGLDVQIRVSESAFDIGRVSVVSGSRLPAMSALAAPTVARTLMKRRTKAQRPSQRTAPKKRALPRRKAATQAKKRRA